MPSFSLQSVLLLLAIFIWGPFLPESLARSDSLPSPDQDKPQFAPLASPNTSLDDRAEFLLALSRKRGSLSYEEASIAAYNLSEIPQSLLAQKRNWRKASAATGFVYLSDYSKLSEYTPVSFYRQLPSDSQNSSLIAIYRASDNRIIASSQANGSTLMHEAGHSLQRTAICHHAKALSYSLDPLAPKTRTSARARLLEHFRYLSSQDELEVRLQDLNRFHASAFDGKFLLTPLDSIAALSALGMTLTTPEIEKALATNDSEIEQSRIEQALALGQRKTGPASLKPFSDAKELLVLRRLSLRVDPERWPHLLAKVIYEAPGHL